MRIESFITATNKVSDEVRLFALFDVALKSFGMDAGYAYGALTHFDSYDFETNLPTPAIMSTYSDTWIGRYMEKNYAEVDPTVALAPKMPSPFYWEDITGTDESAQAFLDEAKFDAGLNQGLCIPLHGPFNDTFAISAASTEKDLLSEDELSTLYLICSQFHQTFIRLNQNKSKEVALTAKQCECLKWVAAEKSNWEIGVIMGISERTVRYHLTEAFSRLQVASRETAVLKAIMMGLIQP